jgi:hypothetical protein
LAFSELIKGEYSDREKRVIAFISLLHLDNQQRVWLEQENHFDEIWLWLKNVYESKNKDFLEALRLEVEEYLAQERKREELDSQLQSEEKVDGESIEDDFEPEKPSVARVVNEEE